MSGWNSPDEAFAKLRANPRPHWDNYLGFYSSWLGGYFREPWAMLLPMDDHGFHRGDAVFEAARIVDRAFIDLPAHLKRLQNSARSIQMELPKSLDEIGAICVQLGKLCDSPAGILRLYVTRGPGGFSPSPSEVTGHQVYAAITKAGAASPERYEKGVSAMISTVAAKEQRWAQIKSCNYLQNVLMKKESLDKGFDFAISVDERGRVCEGATENLMIVSAQNELLVPHFDYTLRGTTVAEVMKIAEDLKKAGRLRDVRLADLTVGDLRAAKEAAFVGTTLGVLPVSSLDRQPVGTGRGGEIGLELNRQLMQRMASDPALRTPF
jgi:4-amino-4-deoxychorismate lyase